MTMMRRCDACEAPIQQDQFFEVQIRLLASSEEQSQDPVGQWYGDFCDACVEGGQAIKELLRGCRSLKDVDK